LVEDVHQSIDVCSRFNVRFHIDRFTEFAMVLPFIAREASDSINPRA
jgi:hypothetical protein